MGDTRILSEEEVMDAMDFIDLEGFDLWVEDQAADLLEGTGLEKKLRAYVDSKHDLLRALSELGFDL